MERKSQHLAAREPNAKLKRTAWLATTALTAILFHPGQLLAQPALSPTTTPQGGVVVAGSSTIAQNTGSTTITQTSASTVINWQSFNVGGKAQVTFAQPSSSAIALNRVVTATPSIIAGKINANGQIVLVNQSGVVFTKGSQVNAESIVVSTSNISNADFMAGHLVFSGAPNPGAKIVNNGTLTAREAGLVGLVAPQVANNGVITAQLGQVVLAGASAFTLDLYGDRLISLDVTQAVRAVDVDGKTVPALVTNRGLILADGGKITLTAQDADALVTQLINAGGTLRANTVGRQTGTVTIQGVGGNIQIAGNLLAQGTQSGSKGGAIEALTTGTVSVAAGAVIDASGNAGGGVVALGTDLQRATAGAADTTAPRAAAVDVASTAVVKADATGNGNGGKVTLLSAQDTDFAGTISTQGGTLGGNGGTVEISSDGVINLSGTVFDTAFVDGQAGEILLDPATLVIGTGTPAAATTGTTTIGGFSNNGTSYIDPASLSSLAGTIVLEADSLITVASAINLTGASALSLVSNGAVTVGASISLAGSLEIDAAGSMEIGAGLTAGNITLKDNSSGTIGIDIDAPITAGTLVALQSGGGIDENSNGLINAPTLTSTGSNDGDDVLSGANTVSGLGSFSVAAGGELIFTDTGSLSLIGPISAPSATLRAGTIGVAGDVSVSGALALEASSGGITEGNGGGITAGTLNSGGTTIGGDVSLASTANSIGTLGAFAASGNILLDDATALNISGLVTTPDALTLEDGGAVTELTGGTISVAALSSGGTTIGGNVSLASTANSIGTLEGFILSGTHALTLVDSGALDVAGTVTAGAATLDAATLTLDAPLSITNALTLEAGSGGITEDASGGITAGTLSSGGTTIGGDVSLASTTNSIGTLDAFAASGNILLDDTTALNISGLVTTPDALMLEDSGAVTEQTGGTISVATLSSGGTTIGGNVSLTGTANSIGALGAFAASGNILLDDATALNISGLVATPSTLTLEDSGTVTEQNGGTISVTTLSSGGTTIGGNVSLASTANSIGRLEGFILSGTHALTLVDSGALDVTGTVTAGAATLDAATLTLDAPLSITNALTLEAGGGGITEDANGSITAATLSSGGTTIGGDVSLASTANSIGALADFILSGTHALTFVDSGALDVAGTVTAGAATLDAATLTLDAPLSITNALTLEAGGGGITEDASGRITAGTLSSGGTTIGGDVSLASTTNSIGTLGAFAASGNILLNDTTALNIAGLVTTPGTLTLEDSGAVTEQTGGTISAATLSSGGTTIGGDVSLASTANSIGALADFILSGTHALTLVDSGALDVTGTVTAGAATLDAATLTLDAPLSITNTLMLEAGSGGITEDSSGGITAGTLSSGGTTIGGDVSLGNTNSIGTLGTFAASGNILLENTGTLNIAGLVTTPGTLTLEDSGAVTELTGGTISAVTLTTGTATIGGAVSLGNANTIGALGTFAASGNILLENTGTLNIAGLVTTPDTLKLEDSGAVVELAGGIISAATLTTGTTTIGGDVSLGNTNTIGALGAFAASGNILLNDAGGLNIAGLVTTPGTLMLEDNGTVTELTGGMISAATLTTGTTTIGGDVSLGNTNTIGALGAFVASGNILLDDAGGLNIAGLVTTPGTLTLEDNGAVTELTGGVISAAILTTGTTTIGGDVALDNANSIGTLKDFSLSGTHALTLLDSGALDVAGTVTAGAATLDAATLTLDAPLSISNTLALEAGAGGITEGADGRIAAGTLNSGGTTIGGDVSLGNTNTIITLGAFAASGNILLDDSGALDVEGMVSAGAATLEAATLTLDAALSITNTLALEAGAGGITEGAGGSITAGTLSSGNTTIDGAVALGNANTIATLGAFAARGNILLDDTGPLNIAGLVTTPGTLTVVDSGALDVAGTVTAGAATLEAAGLTLDAPLSITNALTLEAGSGGITEDADGSITAGTLNSGNTTIGGDVSLASTANSIATLGNFAVGTGDAFDLNDMGSLVVAGLVTAPSVTLSAGSIAVQNEISASGALSLISTSGVDVTGTADAGTLALQAGGNVSNIGGTIVAGMLTTGAGSISGNAVLTGSNTVAQLGSFTVGENFSLANTGSLLVAAPVQASTVWLADQGAVTLGAPVTATAGQVTLAVNGLLAGGGSITANGGTISITPYTSGMAVDLGGTAIGGLELSSLLVSELDPNAAVISITTTGSMFTEGTLAFSNPDLMLAAGGPITQTGTLGGDVIDLSGSSLTLDGMLTATSLNLASPGGVTQSAGGVLAVGTLSSGTTTIGGAVALNGTANAIATLGAFTAAQNFMLDDGAALTVNGPLNAANITLTDGSPTASSIALDGRLTAGTGGRINLMANRLSADGASLLAAGGTVAITPYSTGTAIDLGGTAAGLDLSSALLAAVGSTTSLLDIHTTGSIAADGAVTVTAGTLALSGNGIAFNGMLDLPGAGVLQVASTNGITTAAGETLTASTLRAGGAITGPVNMAAGTNNIGTLGAMVVSGTNNTLALRDAVALDVTGVVSAGNISLNAAGLTIANTIAATAVTLNSSNGIAETGGGLINAPSLSSGGTTITGRADLSGANTIATLNGFLTGGNLLLNDTSALTLAGTVSGANITLSANGLTFGGAVNTPGLLALSSNAGISQQGGTIGAAVLTSNGTIGGAVDLTAAGNAIRTLGAFTATGDFTLVDGAALTLNGPLYAANVTLGAAGLALDGAVSTGVLQLTSSAGVNEGTGGQVNAALLTTGNTGVTRDAVLNNADNQVAALGNFAASGSLTLNDAAALSLTGPVTLGGTLALLDPDGITQSGGSITAAALTSDGGTIGGNAVFTSRANDIPVLGNFAATGDVSFTDAGPLSLQGNINAGGALNLNANGAISQNGGVIFAPLLNAAAPSITLTDANNIAALGNVSASGDVDINGASSLSGQLTANNATLAVPGDFTLSGGAEINDALDITAAGNVDQTSGTVNAQTATISAADITLSGTTAIADQLDLAAAENITHGAGVLSAGTLVGSAGQLASFAATTDFGTLGSFIMQDSLFSLKNAGALIITGPVVASAISITAAGMVTLLGSTEGGLFITGSIAPDQTTRPRPGDSVITVTPGANGAAPEIVQTGTFLINAGPNAAQYGKAGLPATLFLNTTPNGTINFANYPDGLYAPSIDLILSAGGQGTISGNVNLQHIEITSALSTELTGTIDNVVGPTAAGNGSAAPFPQPNFRFNTCPIGSVNCMIVSIETLPAGNPLENFDISSRKHKQLYRNVQLPGIATRDF